MTKTDRQRKLDRKQREAAGRRAERVATLMLLLKGYRILASRFQGAGGEIDLVVAKPFLGPPKIIVFVEVKQRTRASDLNEAISPRQQARIEAGAGGFLAAHPHLATCAQRFDGILISPGTLPRHHKNLWQSAN